MKRIIIPVIAVSLLVLGVGIVPLALADSVGRDKPTPLRVIRLTERVRAAPLFQDADPPGPSLGDRLLFSADLFDAAGRHVGQDGADCVTLRIDPTAPPEKQAIVQCVITANLFGEGQLTLQSLAQGTENYFAVTGGTGAFRAARGEAFAKDITPLVEAEVTITLVNGRE